MRLKSSLSSQSARFQEQRTEMLDALAELRRLEALVRAESEGNRPKFESRGQLLPRERLALLLDRGRPFLELSTLAGLGMHDDDGVRRLQGGGSIMGIGWVSGTRVVVYAHDAAIKGGAISPMGLKKVLRAQELALKQRLPMINLVESAGANLNYQAELFVEGGRAFANQARLSAAGLPQITIVYGSSTAGGAYVPGLSDYVIMVKDRAKVFLAGPPLVQAATGERSTDEELGGASMHATMTGLNELYAHDDREATLLARAQLKALNWRPRALFELSEERPPRYSPDELCGVTPLDYRKPYHPHELIARLVDDSELLEFKPSYGADLVVGWAELYGQRVGVISNHGPIFPEGATKAAQFIELCCQSQTPLIFLQNTTGFMVGRAVEAAGSVRCGARMIKAVATAQVPKLTLLVGGAFGAGHYAMCGRAYDPDFIFAWPSNRLAVMGGQQAGEVYRLISTEKIKQRGGEISPHVEAELKAISGRITEQIERESHALYATARLWDDGVVDPRDSRRVLGEALMICLSARDTDTQPLSFGVTR